MAGLAVCVNLKGQAGKTIVERRQNSSLPLVSDVSNRQENNSQTAVSSGQEKFSCPINAAMKDFESKAQVGVIPLIQKRGGEYIDSEVARMAAES